LETLLIEGGSINAIGGAAFPVPEGAERVDAAGLWVLPGLIDGHTHVGIAEEGIGWAGDDTNATTQAVGAQVRAIGAINPFDQGFADTVAGGVVDAQRSLPQIGQTAFAAISGCARGSAAKNGPDGQQD